MKRQSLFAETADRLKKPVKAKTLKRRRHREKAENIAIVREQVMARDHFECRIQRIMRNFAIYESLRRPLELAHIDGRGMGGNPDLSRDTTENTVSVSDHLHRGARSLHSGHIKVRPLTDKGANGPCCFEFYEKLPTEVR